MADVLEFGGAPDATRTFVSAASKPGVQTHVLPVWMAEALASTARVSPSEDQLKAVQLGDLKL